MGSVFCDQRILIRILQAIQLKIDIQLRPVQVMTVKQLNVEHLLNRGRLKPGVLVVR